MQLNMKIKINKQDFLQDWYTSELINIDELLLEIKKKKIELGKRKNTYISEVIELYYEEKHKKNLLEVLSLKYNIPICPITGSFVAFRHGGQISFFQFSKNVNRQKRNAYVAKNNENAKKHIEKMKVERKGSGNPAFGSTPWNKGLTIETSEVIRLNTEKKQVTISNYSQETKDAIKKKQSESAKIRLVHGHTGKPHSEETKELLRQITISRIKNNKFPQTNSTIHIKFRELLIKLNVKFEEEVKIGKFSFDFKVGNVLIEVQGDYWHCNPFLEKYREPKTKGQRVNYLRDFVKDRFINEDTNYQLEKVWENDINNNIEKVELCLKKLLNV